MLTRELAEEIVRETMVRLNRNINLMDPAGIILASGDSGRVGQFHEAAAEAIRRDRELPVKDEDLRRWKGAQKGINLPIHYEGRVVGAIGITGDPQEVQPFGHLVKMTTELMIRQYHLKLQDEWKQMTVDWIVQELLQPEPDMELIEQRLRAAGRRLEPPYQIAAAAYRLPADSKGRESLPALVSRMLAAEEVLISSYRPQKLLMIFSRAEAPSVGRKLEKLSGLLRTETETYCIGAGSPCPDRKELRTGFQEAELALRFGLAAGETLVRYDAVEAKALVHEIPAEHRDRLLRKLLPRLNAKMGETLACYFECSLNIAAAAKKLGIHRNTLIYRLEQIKTTTGYDPGRFEDALVLQFVLWLHRP